MSGNGYKRIVAKFGTSLLTGGTEQLDLKVMSGLVAQVAQLRRDGKEVVIVTSGAIAAGRQKLGISREERREKEHKGLPFKQVLAAVGQSHLMQTYEQLFKWYNLTVAQALLTKADLADRSGYLNARNTLLALIEMGVIAIINENDVVAIDEIETAKFGDNDNLSATVANLIDADLLVLLTNIDGLYTSDPRKNAAARLIPRVEKIDAELERLVSGATDGLGTGGMATKLEAARLATSSGITMVIANGYKTDILTSLAAGQMEGTLFVPQVSHREAKKRWLLCGLTCKGQVTIDKGALNALINQNRSLLPAGIAAVSGDFQRGDIVDIFDQSGNHVGSGIINYGAADLVKIKGIRSDKIAEVLGYEYGAEAIHRNNMVAG
ncbi:MAG: glutamate 5-kinase [Chloroflexota bacterium]